MVVFQLFSQPRLHQVFSKLWSTDREVGSILVLVLILLTSLFAIGLFLQDHLLLQAQIVENLYMEMRTYYLSQAGIEFARYRLKLNRFWQTDSYILPIDTSEQIVLKTYLDNGKIVVESRGVVQQYHTTTIAYFSNTLPLKRIG